MLRFIANLDLEEWTQQGHVESNNFEMQICLYVPFKTKVKNFKHWFDIQYATKDDLAGVEFEYFTKENLDLPELSARVLTAYRVKNLDPKTEYTIDLFASNLRKEFHKSFAFATP